MQLQLRQLGLLSTCGLEQSREDTQVPFFCMGDRSLEGYSTKLLKIPLRLGNGGRTIKHSFRFVSFSLALHTFRFPVGL